MKHELSKERLAKIIETADEIITVNDGTNEDISKNDTKTIIGLYDHLNDDLAPPAVVKAMARALLAAHEQEPVADVVAWSHPTEERTCEVRLRRFDLKPGELYYHPVPVVECKQEPVAVVELSDYVTVAQLSGDEPRKKAVKELYEGALVVGQNLYTHPAPSIPAAVPEEMTSDYAWGKLGISAEDCSAWADGWNARAAMLHSEPAGWIPVSERLPEPNTYVLVSNGVWVGQGAYNDSDHLDDDEHWQDEHHEFINLIHHPVTHWQPLPAASKGV